MSQNLHGGHSPAAFAALVIGNMAGAERAGAGQSLNENTFAHALAAASLEFHITKLMENCSAGTPKVRDSSLGVLKIEVEAGKQDMAGFTVSVSRLNPETGQHDSVFSEFVTKDNLSSRLLTAGLGALHDQLRVTTADIEQYPQKIWAHRIELILNACARSAEQVGTKAAGDALDRIRVAPPSPQEILESIKGAGGFDLSFEQLPPPSDTEKRQAMDVMLQNFAVMFREQIESVAAQRAVIAASDPGRVFEIAVNMVDAFATKVSHANDSEGDALRSNIRARNLQPLSQILIQNGLIPAGSNFEFSLFNRDSALGTTQSLSFSFVEQQVLDQLTPVVTAFKSGDLSSVISSPTQVGGAAGFFQALGVELLLTHSDLTGMGLTAHNVVASLEKVDPVRLKQVCLDYLDGLNSGLKAVVAQLAPDARVV